MQKRENVELQDPLNKILVSFLSITVMLEYYKPQNTF